MMRTAKLAGLVLMLMASGSKATATLYNPTTDFSITNGNPNGVWTYGTYDAAGTAFTPYAVPAGADAAWHGNSNLKAWSQHLYDSGAYSVVGKNVSGTLQNESAGGSIAVDPGTLFFHPGNSGEKATIRFIAPSAGTVDISAIFTADDTSAGNRDVHVYVNGSALFNGAVVGNKSSAPPASFSQAGIPLTAGSTVDFAVGYGSDANYSNDATSLTASLNFVPEPSSLVLMGLAALGLFAAVRRRRA